MDFDDYESSDDGRRDFGNRSRPDESSDEDGKGDALHYGNKLFPAMIDYPDPTILKIISNPNTDKDELYEIDDEFISPLIFAIKRKNYFIIKALLEHGANPDFEPEDTSPLNEAVWLNDIVIIKLLLYYGALPTNELIVCTNVDIARLLISHGADVNAMNNDSGENCLTNATWNQDMDMIKLLIENGANVNPPISHPPILIACMTGNADIVKFFINAGAHFDEYCVNNANREIHEIFKEYTRELINERINMYKWIRQSNHWLTDDQIWGHVQTFLPPIPWYLNVYTQDIKQEMKGN